MTQILLPSGTSFEAGAGETLLDAGLRAGVPLPYSCRTGRCSTCRCRPLRGETRALHAELGLDEKERLQGWILACVRTACTDVALDVEELGDVAIPAPRTVPCRIHALESPAPDVMRVLLRLPPGAQFAYLPGQYIDLIGPQGVRRSYSLANAPRRDGLLELHVRAVEGGVLSAYWFGAARANDLLRLQGPLGTFFLRDVSGRDLVFLATGTGIAPVKAMLEALDATPTELRPASATVFWGGRVARDFYCDPLQDAPTAAVRLVRVLSRADAVWGGARGHVQDAWLRESPALANAVVYACGSDAMIQSSRTRLESAGLPARRFRADAFVSSGTPT